MLYVIKNLVNGTYLARAGGFGTVTESMAYVTYQSAVDAVKDYKFDPNAVLTIEPCTKPTASQVVKTIDEWIKQTKESCPMQVDLDDMIIGKINTMVTNLNLLKELAKGSEKNYDDLRRGQLLLQSISSVYLHDIPNDVIKYFMC